MRALCVDTETSGLDPATGDELVEVAYALFSTSHKTIVRAGSVLVQTDAGSEIGGIPAGVAREYGVDRPLVFPGHDLVIAHSAEFDAKWLPELRASTWVCSMSDIEWPKKPMSGSLAVLLLSHGLGVVEAHRAMPDAWAIARLLTKVAADGHDVEAMLTKAMRPKVLVVSLATFEQKDLVKSHGFVWDRIVAKTWARKMPREDVEALPFQCRVQE